MTLSFQHFSSLCTELCWETTLLFHRKSRTMRHMSTVTVHDKHTLYSHSVVRFSQVSRVIINNLHQLCHKIQSLALNWTVSDGNVLNLFDSHINNCISNSVPFFNRWNQTISLNPQQVQLLHLFDCQCFVVQLLLTINILSVPNCNVCDTGRQQSMTHWRRCKTNIFPITTCLTSTWLWGKTRPSASPNGFPFSSLCFQRHTPHRVKRWTGVQWNWELLTTQNCTQCHPTKQQWFPLMLLPYHHIVWPYTSTTNFVISKRFAWSKHIPHQFISCYTHSNKELCARRLIVITWNTMNSHPSSMCSILLSTNKDTCSQ